MQHESDNAQTATLLSTKYVLTDTRECGGNSTLCIILGGAALLSTVF